MLTKLAAKEAAVEALIFSYIEVTNSGTSRSWSMLARSASGLWSIDRRDMSSVSNPFTYGGWVSWRGPRWYVFVPVVGL